MTSLKANQLIETDRQSWRNRGDLNLSEGSSILTPLQADQTASDALTSWARRNKTLVARKKIQLLILLQNAKDAISNVPSRWPGRRSERATHWLSSILSELTALVVSHANGRATPLTRHGTRPDEGDLRPSAPDGTLVGRPVPPAQNRAPNDRLGSGS